MSAIERAIERVEQLIADSEREQRVILVSLSDDPDNPGHTVGWEEAYALEDDELQRRFDSLDELDAWELAQSEHYEAYDEENGKQAALHHVLSILREEADRV